MKNNLKPLLISILSLVIFTIIIYQILSYLNPPITEDGHPYMPTQNILKSIFYSLIIGTIIFFISRRKLMKKKK